MAGDDDGSVSSVAGDDDGSVGSVTGDDDGSVGSVTGDDDGSVTGVVEIFLLQKSVHISGAMSPLTIISVVVLAIPG